MSSTACVVCGVEVPRHERPSCPPMLCDKHQREAQMPVVAARK